MQAATPVQILDSRNATEGRVNAAMNSAICLGAGANETKIDGFISFTLAWKLKSGG